MSDLTDLAQRVRSNSGLTDDEQVAITQQSDAAGDAYHSLLSKVGHRQLLKDVPGVLKRVIQTRAWERWHWAGHDFTAPSLGAYLTRNPPDGLGTTLDMVEALVQNDQEILALWREQTTAKHGGDRKSEAASIKTDNISLDPKHGTSRAYTLARLKAERADLFERVIAGELTAHAAAIEAGFRKPPSPLPALRRAWNKASEEERAAFLAEVTS